MLNRTKHEIVMRNILDTVYSNTDIGSLLGFKGGTACYFFYGLPRFSTDLDFNLLDSSKRDFVFESLQDILSQFGQVTDKYIKFNTIFFFLTHTEERSGIKIEISTREIEKVNSYELLEFYGTSILVMKREDIFANKLIALRYRQVPTSRDLYDINYFFKQNWNISYKIIEAVTGKNALDYISELPQFIRSNFSKKTISFGLGELVNDESQRDFIKNRLIDDTINQINFYVDRMKSVD